MASRYNEHLTFRVPVPRGQEKFRELILYIAEKCQNAEYFGAVKLNKILYHSDFRAFRRLGEPVTGAEYFRLPRGPAPRVLVPVRREMLAEGLIDLDVRPIGNHEQQRVVPKRAANIDLFTAGELEIVDQVIEELWDQTADEASDASHDLAWQTRADEESIPYESAFLDDSPLTEDIIKRTHELAEEHGW